MSLFQTTAPAVPLQIIRETRKYLIVDAPGLGIAEGAIMGTYGCHSRCCRGLVPSGEEFPGPYSLAAEPMEE